MANFAVTIALVSASALAAIYSSDTNLRMLTVDAELSPSLTLATGEKRNWIVNPMGIEKDFPLWGIPCLCGELEVPPHLCLTRWAFLKNRGTPFIAQIEGEAP